MENIQVSWIERRDNLKKSICTYFLSRGFNQDRVAKIAGEISWKGAALVEIAAQFDEGWLPTTERDIDNFPQEHKGAVADFINSYAQLYKESLDFLEEQRDYGEKICSSRDDFEREDWESNQPKAEIQLHPNCIKVFSFGYHEGFASTLPKSGKKSIGKTLSGGYEWEYPLSSLSELKALGLPVIYAIDYVVEPL